MPQQQTPTQRDPFQKEPFQRPPQPAQRPPTLPPGINHILDIIDDALREPEEGEVCEC